MVAAIPLSILTKKTASLLFVSGSAFLLAYGMTRNGWHLLPLFVTSSFASSAQKFQWSILFTAALFTPWLAIFVAAKPQGGIGPVISASTSKPLVIAAIGGATLSAISLLLLP
ncbi:MAG: hypothetical protein ACR2G6_05750 [Gemmatimonadaceae bacterium]